MRNESGAEFSPHPGSRSTFDLSAAMAFSRWPAACSSFRLLPRVALLQNLHGHAG